MVELLMVLLTSLSAFIVVIPGAYFTYLLSRHITFIGGYVRAFYEEDACRFGWESARATYGEVDSKGKITTKKCFAAFYFLFGVYALLFSLIMGISAFSSLTGVSVNNFDGIGLLVTAATPAQVLVFVVFLLVNCALFAILLGIVAILLLDFGYGKLKSRFTDGWNAVRASRED